MFDNKNEAEKVKGQSAAIKSSPLSQQTHQDNSNVDKTASSNFASNLESVSVSKEECLKSITSPTFLAYCRNSWDAKFCCDLPSCKNKC